MKSGYKGTIWFAAFLLIWFFGGCAQEEQLPVESSKPSQPVKAEPVKAVAAEIIVGEIGEYVITTEQVKQTGRRRLRDDLYIDGRGSRPRQAREILLELLAEKAMATKGRSQGLLEDEITYQSIKRFKDKKLVGSLLTSHLKSKIHVSDARIEALMKTDAKLTRENARAKLAQEQANKLRGEFYEQLYKKYKVEKLRDNFQKAGLTHNRLLKLPRKNARTQWVISKQVRDALTAEERATVLAEFDGEQITIKDWLYGLCEIAPPGRATFLKGSKGIEQLLDRLLKTEIFVHEAIARGFDKNEGFVKKVKEREDTMLTGKIRSRAYSSVKNTEDKEQLLAYFNAHKEYFGTPATLKVDQIWCNDLKSAQQARAQLDSGKDFAQVKDKYDVMGIMRQKEPQIISPVREGFFFDQLWVGEPGSIVGPVKGTSYEGLKWRVVKIYEKTPGEIKEYSDDMKNSIQMKLQSVQVDRAILELQNQLLEKYPYKIYEDRLEGLDPLEIP
ncbi:hypothetical protein ACFL3G_07760 [Planctomycetota bacterium]